MKETYSIADFVTDQDIRWCPGCGDFAILKQLQAVMPALNVPKENIVFISGIGCSSRLPYYMNTYGMHSIHGRATAIATGLKLTNPALSVWVITGDGDGLSIGGNHLIHLFRRNVDTNVVLFNNEIYGLTKGQYSPTSVTQTITKSSPSGSIDDPFNPIALALGANATFIARTIDREPRHLQEILLSSHHHKGTSFVEIYQNCHVFNDGVFSQYTDRKTRQDHTLFLKGGHPLVFGKNGDKGIKLDGYTPKVVYIDENNSPEDLWIHDEKDETKAHILSRFFGSFQEENNLPRPFGIFFRKEKPTYENLLEQEIRIQTKKRGISDIQKLISGEHTWNIS